MEFIHGQQDEAVKKAVEFMDFYSFKPGGLCLYCGDVKILGTSGKGLGQPNLQDGVQPAIKAALTKAFNKGSRSLVIWTAHLINLPGIKKAPKKGVAAILESAEDELAADNGDALAENEENSSDTEDLGDTASEEKPQLD